MNPAPSPRRAPAALTLLAFAAAICVLFGGLGGLPLVEPDEGRNAEVARELKVSGDWLVPTLNEVSYLDKPSFYFKASALAQQVVGSTPGAARFPSALSALLSLVCLFAFCRPRYGERAAALGVLIAGTSPLFFVFGRLVIMDSMLALFVSAAIFAAVHAEDCAGARRRGWYLASAVCVGLATVVKGPIGFLLPGLVVVAFFLAEGRNGALRRCFAPLHVLVFLAVALAWLLPLVRAQPEFLRYGLVEESFHRFTTPQFKRAAPFWYYLPVVFLGIFAWGVLLPADAVRAWQTRRRWSSTDRLFIVWTAVAVAFFTLSNSKRPGYVLTLMLALGALSGRLLARAWADPESVVARSVRRAALASAALLGLVGIGLLVWARGGAAARNGPEIVAAALRVGAGFLVLAALAAWAWRSRSPRLLTVALALVPAVMLGVGWSGVRTYAAQRSAAGLVEHLRQRGAERSAVACLECFPGGLAFTLGRPLAVVDSDGLLDELRSNWVLYGAARGKVLPAHYMKLRALDAWLAEPRPEGTCLVAGKAMLPLMKEVIRRRAGWQIESVPGGWLVACSPLPREAG